MYAIVVPTAGGESPRKKGKKMKAAFAELTEKQINYIEGAEFDRMIVTKTDIAEASEALELDGKTHEELTAIRNAVVKHLANLKGIRRDAGDWGEFDRLNTNLSAITCIIDSRIYA